MELLLPLPLSLVLIITSLGIAWIVAYKSKDIGTFNWAVGTKLVTTETMSIGYVSTKWLVFFVPVLPVKSYKVIAYRPNTYINYDALQPLPHLEKSQILMTYKKNLPWYLLILAGLVGIALLGTWKCF